jgi:hypothetical protein
MAVVAVAIAMFISLLMWGGGFFGWYDPQGKVQLALATSFILGCVSAYKSRGD